MKQFVGTCIDTSECQKMASNENSENSEIKSGRLRLVQKHKGKSLRVQVFIRVYRNCFEHYAVLYKDQRYSLQSGFISLKNCIVHKCTGKENQLRVTLNDFEGTGLLFESNTREETDDWLMALQPTILSSSPPKSSISPNLSPVIPRSPLMPTLAEESDEDL